MGLGAARESRPVRLGTIAVVALAFVAVSLSAPSGAAASPAKGERQRSDRVDGLRSAG